MSVLVDTGVLYADHDTEASRHEAAQRALEVVYDGEFGQPYVSDYIFDEAVTLTQRRAGASTRCCGSPRLCFRIRLLSSNSTTIKS